MFEDENLTSVVLHLAETPKVCDICIYSKERKKNEVNTFNEISKDK